MNNLRNNPRPHRVPRGLEWTTLKTIPVVLLGGILIPLSLNIGSRFFPPGATANEVAEHFVKIDIVSIATAVMVTMTALTVGIFCFTLAMMKGPARVADAYYLPDSERPAREGR